MRFYKLVTDSSPGATMMYRGGVAWRGVAEYGRTRQIPRQFVNEATTVVGDLSIIIKLNIREKR